MLIACTDTNKVARLVMHSLDADVYSQAHSLHVKSEMSSLAL